MELVYPGQKDMRI